MGNFYKKIGHQKLTKVAQSGRTDRGKNLEKANSRHRRGDNVVTNEAWRTITITITVYTIASQFGRVKFSLVMSCHGWSMKHCEGLLTLTTTAATTKNADLMTLLKIHENVSSRYGSRNTQNCKLQFTSEFNIIFTYAFILKKNL